MAMHPPRRAPAPSVVSDRREPPPLAPHTPPLEQPQHWLKSLLPCPTGPLVHTASLYKCRSRTLRARHPAPHTPAYQLHPPSQQAKPTVKLQSPAPHSPHSTLSLHSTPPVRQ